MPFRLAGDPHSEPADTAGTEAAAVGQRRKSLISRLFATSGAPASRKSSRKRGRRSDLVVAALGATLGLISALFPWYIFYNPDQFGVRAIKLGTGEFAQVGSMPMGEQSIRVGAPIAVDPSEVQPMQLDLFATGTTSNDAGNDPKAPEAQPFPGEHTPFKLVHVANGRAMIEDDTGLFIVQRGSSLPDRSTVKSIEQRDGQWVIVTSADEVVEVSE